MSLIVKVGGRESNSFVTLAEANAIMEVIFSEAEFVVWDDLEDSQKEYRLKLAARMIETLPYRGWRAYCGQSLCFPRTTQHNVKVIPEEVKETQCFVALNIIHKGLSSRPSPDEAESGALVSSVSLGGLLGVKFTGDDPTTGTGLDQIIRSSQFPAYVRMRRYSTQFRGGTVRNEDNMPTCSTTTTTTTTTT